MEIFRIMYKLNEGLNKKDLEFMVDQTITIDDFESKIDSEEAIVVTFYVKESWPAKDLKKFIEKSHIDIIDVDLSLAPDIDGNFLVFIEMNRDDTFPEKLLDIVGTLKNLTNIDNYKFKAYKQKGTFDLTEENVKDKVRLTQKNDNELKETQIFKFMEESNLNNVSTKRDTITFTRRGVDYRFKLVDFGNINSVFNRHTLHESAQSFNSGILGLESVLGNNWNVALIDDYTMLTKLGSTDALLLKKV